MRTKSEFFKGVYFERWGTPISHGQSLSLWGVLVDHTLTHFYFTVDEEKDCHVMTIDRLWPYRMIEEQYAHKCLGKYFRVNPKGKKKPRPQFPRYFKTWKMWGTSFIKELDEGYALSGYNKVRNKNHVAYLIETKDVWIEIVSGVPE